MENLMKLLLLTIVIGLFVQTNNVCAENDSTLVTEKSIIPKPFHSPTKALLLSLFLPGTGHFYNGNNKKGCIFAGVRCIPIGLTCGLVWVALTGAAMEKSDPGGKAAEVLWHVDQVLLIASLIATIFDIDMAYKDAEKIRDGTVIKDSLHSDATIQIHLVPPAQVPQGCQIKEKYSGEMLSSGMYAFKSLSLKENKGISIKDGGPVVIYVTENLKIADCRNAENQEAIMVVGSPESLRVIESNSPKKEKREKRKWVKGIIYVPENCVSD